MATVIGITAPIEGAGKTTTAINLAAALAVYEKPTLLVDCDPQNDCLFGVFSEPDPNSRGLAGSLGDDARFSDFVLSTRMPHLHLLPAGIELETTIGHISEADNRCMEIRHKFLEDTAGFDYVIVDTPSAISVLLDWSLQLADELVVPFPLENGSSEQNLQFALETMKQLMTKVIRIRKKGAGNLKISGILLNRCRNLESIKASMPAAFFRQLRHFCLPTTIPRDQNLADARFLGKPVVHHDIGTPAAAAYLELARHWIEKS